MLLFHQREVLSDRHLHQVLMCILFAACRVEDPDRVTFRSIINEHQSLFSHLKLGYGRLCLSIACHSALSPYPPDGAMSGGKSARVLKCPRVLCCSP